MPTRIERARHHDLDRIVDQITTDDNLGTASLLVVTTTVMTYPTTAGVFYATNPVEIDGTELEGNAATYAPDGSQVIYCLNTGTQVPPSGTRVIASAVGGRWVFRYDG